MLDKNAINDAINAEKEELKTWQVVIFIAIAVVMDIIALVNHLALMG